MVVPKEAPFRRSRGGVDSLDVDFLDPARRGRVSRHDRHVNLADGLAASAGEVKRPKPE